jgi:hypothetical protein
MKIRFDETEVGTHLTLVPETQADSDVLKRLPRGGGVYDASVVVASLHPEGDFVETFEQESFQPVSITLRKPNK